MRDIYYFFSGIIILCVSVLVRFLSYPVITSDYQSYVSVWFATLAKAPGLSAFKVVFANYAPLYLYFLKVLTFLPFPMLFSIKVFSSIFDVILALIICALLRLADRARFTPSRLFFVFAIIVSIPTLVLNSSLWAQCDALYASGILASLYFIFRDKPLPASLAFTFALCLKLQAIFFLPILLGYLAARGFKFFYVLLLPLLFALSVAPVLLAGGPFTAWALQYAYQAGEYPYLTLNAPSVFAFISTLPLSALTQSLLSYAGILISGIGALVILGLTWFSERRQLNKAEIGTENRLEKILYLSLISVIFIPFFLPHMHERYFYLADIIATCLAMYKPALWYVPVLVVGASFISYIPYLSQYSSFLGHFVVPLWIAAAGMCIALVFISYRYVRLMLHLRFSSPVVY